jgi:hypothetical protein
MTQYCWVYIDKFTDDLVLVKRPRKNTSYYKVISQNRDFITSSGYVESRLFKKWYKFLGRL